MVGLIHNISYFIGVRYGREFLIKYGKYIFINERMIQKLEDFVAHHGSKVVVVARFILALRQINGFLMGAVKMPWIKFLVFNLIGAILWAGWWIGIAYYIGKKFDGLFVKYSFLIGVIVSVAFVIFVCIKWKSEYGKNE